MSQHDHGLINRLGEETSPYLLQHKDNPVAWQPWGEEAFTLARQLDRPVLLSVGYAACHWCHVMAHESFEEEGTAALMNDLFVNIKVDREERPDVDNVFQTALSLLGQQGGWPLTMFLTPEGEPFWGGTYFPPSQRWGRPSFAQVLSGVAEAYRNRREDVGRNVSAIRDALEKTVASAPGALPSSDLIVAGARQIAGAVDPQEGGLRGAPKFPQPSLFKLVWQGYLRSGEAGLRQAVELTLTRMSQGGIYDHVGGGFARYSTDAEWLVPHFEKMLYDNAQLLDLLALVWAVGGQALFAARAEETVDWLLREMMAERTPGGAPCGAFAASLDADSEGEEGRFYVWDEAELDAVLGERSTAFKAAYGVSPGGNWEGRTILNRSALPNLGDEAGEAALADDRRKLLEARGKRVRPGWDDKVLADWNGLMIGALARAGAVFGRPDWIEAARRAFTFICAEMQVDGRLSHSWRHGRLRHPATLDDYAFLCDAALALAELEVVPDAVKQAEHWISILEKHYRDERGAYFLSADDAGALIVRPKIVADNVTPAGNGVVAQVLARLWHMTGRPFYRDRAEEVIAACAGEIARSPFQHASLLGAVALLQEAVQVVVVGPLEDERTQSLLAVAGKVALPERILLRVENGERLPPEHPAAGKGLVDGGPAVYVCRGTSCSLPLTRPADFAAALQAAGAAG